MLPHKTLNALALSLAFAALIENTRAEDASFGCKVLFLVAAASPSWSGIASCVPVMKQRFT